ncbi:MAG: type II toxin-antitoxin system VapC family toxin [Caulobacteraceae bacterium]
MNGRYLLDTHVFLRIADSSARRSSRTDAILSDPAAELYLSVVSVAEACIKRNLGKLPLPPAIDAAPAEGFRRSVAEAGMNWLPLEPEHAALLRDLPLHHRDPFDRLLICQAMVENLVLVSDDGAFPLYSGLALLRS